MNIVWYSIHLYSYCYDTRLTVDIHVPVHVSGAGQEGAHGVGHPLLFPFFNDINNTLYFYISVLVLYPTCILYVYMHT